MDRRRACRCSRWSLGCCGAGCVARRAVAHAGTGALRRCAARLRAHRASSRCSKRASAGRYVALHVDVLREYLAARIPRLRARSPPRELLTRSAPTRRCRSPRLEPVLAAADLIKYADRAGLRPRARELAARRAASSKRPRPPCCIARRPPRRPSGRVMDSIDLPVHRVRVALGAAAPAPDSALVDLASRAAARPRSCSRASDVLARGPRGGAFTRRAARHPAHAAARGADRRAGAAALGRAHGERRQRRHQHRDRDRSVELDARARLSAAEPARGREGQGQAVHPRPAQRSHRPRRIRRRGADAGAAHRRTIRWCSPRSTICRRASSRTARRSARRSPRRRIVCAARPVARAY